MFEGRPRESLVQYENPIEISGGNNNASFQKSMQGKKRGILPPMESKPK